MQLPQNEAHPFVYMMFIRAFRLDGFADPFEKGNALCLLDSNGKMVSWEDVGTTNPTIRGVWA